MLHETVNTKEILKICKNRYLRYKEVVGVGIGRKDNKEVIIVLASEHTNTILSIPKTIENVEIHVKFVDRIKIQDEDR